MSTQPDPVTPGASIATLGSSQTGTLQATILADGTATPTGTLVLRVASNENPDWQLVTVNYSFAPAVPVLQVSPSSPSLGVASGQTVSQTISLSNTGLAPLTGANIVLQTSQGTLPPGWATLSSASTISSLAVNASQNIAVTFAPDSTVAVGDYYFQVVITAQNYPSYTVPIHVAVNNSTTSGGQFLIVDDFTPGNITTGFTGGLTGATVTLQNQAIYSSVFSVTTGSDGIASFSNLPVGTYSVQITAAQHQTYSGTLTVQPGIQFSQQIVLQYNPVTVTWSVTPTTIQDQYDLVFTTTFDTSVPLPVVTFTPSVINLPQLNQGDAYNVQATLTNSGLIAADNLQIQLPPDDAYFHYAMLGTPPTTLAAGQSVTLYYTLTCLQSLPAPASLTSKGSKNNEMFVNNVEHHPMPLYYRLLSLVIGQIPSSNSFSYGANIGASFSATCASGVLFNGTASETIAYIGASTPQAALQQSQTVVSQQTGGGNGGGNGGTSAPISTPPAQKCQPTCNILIGSPPLLSSSNDPTGTNNRVNPGGDALVDYFDDNNNGIPDWNDPASDFENQFLIPGLPDLMSPPPATPLTPKNGLSEFNLATTGVNGTLTLTETPSSGTPGANVRIWMANADNRLHLVNPNGGATQFTVNAGQYTLIDSSNLPSTTNVQLYLEAIQPGQVTLNLSYKGISDGSATDTANVTLIPGDVAPAVLRVNSSFNEQKINSTTGYAQPDNYDENLTIASGPNVGQLATTNLSQNFGSTAKTVE